MIRLQLSWFRGGISAAINNTCRQQNKILSHNQMGPPSLLPCLSPAFSIQNAPMSYFNARDADTLWKSMQGVSSQGKKRGRSKNLLKVKDLNRGQKPGFGKAKISWPGLTTNNPYSGTGSNIQMTAVGVIKEADFDKYQEELQEERRLSGTRRGLKGKQNPLERGWTGAKPGGRRFGPPQAFNEERSFDNFESILLSYKTLFKMTGNLGRVRRHSILMVTGNRNGSVGFTLTEGKYGKGMKNMRAAVNKAGLRLINIDRFEERTVYHDFFSQFGRTRVIVRQQPPGSGVKAHRAIKAICDLAGIKDLYATCEGNVKNYNHVTKAFILGLLRQKTHQVLADEKQLHLVEMLPENDYFPRVLASPSNGKVRTLEEIEHNEILDFEMISFEGRLPTERIDRHPWEGTPGWDKHLRATWFRQSHWKVRKRMRVEKGDQWGSIRSHLYDKYPECVERNWPEVIRKWRERKMADAED